MHPKLQPSTLCAAERQREREYGLWLRTTGEKVWAAQKTQIRATVEWSLTRQQSDDTMFYFLLPTKRLRHRPTDKATCGAVNTSASGKIKTTASTNVSSS